MPTPDGLVRPERLDRPTSIDANDNEREPADRSGSDLSAARAIAAGCVVGSVFWGIVLALAVR